MPQLLFQELAHQACVTKLTILSQIQIWTRYFADQETIFLEMNKENQKVIFGRSNLEDWIMFSKFSMGGKYSIMIFME